MNKRLIISVILIAMLLLTTTVFASTGTVKFEADKTEVSVGDTFTITIGAKCSDGIEGIDIPYKYDTDKLELVSKIKTNSSFGDIEETEAGENNDTTVLTLICGSKQTITDADNIYTLTFKVKDNVSVGTKAKVETGTILLYSGLESVEESEINIGTKTIEITAKQKTTGGDNDNPTGGTTGGDKDNPTGGTTGTDKDNPTGGTTGTDKDNPTGGTTGTDKDNPTGGTTGTDKDNPTGGTTGTDKDTTTSGTTGETKEKTTGYVKVIEPTNENTSTIQKGTDSFKQTYTGGTLPKTGLNVGFIITGIVVTLIGLIIGYKKSIKYRGL